jgi:hypothetical protein
MKILIALVFSLLMATAHGQIVKQVLDRNSLLPVPFATIKVLHQGRGVVASETGEFQLQISPDDSVLISCVGYFSKVIIGKNIGTKILMEPKTNYLPNLILRNHIAIGAVTIGQTNDKIKPLEYWGPGGSNLKEEFAQKMNLPDSVCSYQLTKVFIPAKKIRCPGSIFLHIYYEDPKSEFPGEEIFIKMISANNIKLEKQEIIIDLNRDSIYLSSSAYFFISVSWPEEAYNSKCTTVIAVSSSSSQTTYCRFIDSNNYNWFHFGLSKNSSGNNQYSATLFYAVLDKLK